MRAEAAEMQFKQGWSVLLAILLFYPRTIELTVPLI